MSSEPEFEMLVHILIAQKHILDASEWCTGGPTMQGMLRAAHAALSSVRNDCSKENQRLAAMRVA